MALPDEDEKHIDFTANVGGKPLKFRLVAEPNKSYGENGVDLRLVHDRTQMLMDHGRDMNDNERQFALMSTLWLALRELRALKDQVEIKDRILEKEKGRFDFDE